MHPQRYLTLLKKSLLNEIYLENELRLLYIFSQLAAQQPIDTAVVREIRQRLPQSFAHILQARQEGRPWWNARFKKPDGTLGVINLRNVCEFSHTKFKRPPIATPGEA